MVLENSVQTEVPADKLNELPPLSWTVRKCEEYKAELTECRSIKEKFHQYFIHGELSDCSQWKQNYNSCLKFRKTGDLKSLEEIIESEKERKRERLEGNIQNDVWEKREHKPPSNWFTEVGETQEEKSSRTSHYLGVMQKEAKQSPTDVPMYGTGCSIL